MAARDVEKLFIQAVLSRGVLTVDVAQSLWEKCIDTVNSSDSNLNIPFLKERSAWDNFVSKVNESLDKLDFEFCHIYDERSGKELYALVNKKGDEIAQMATDHSAAEIAFFKAVVEQIMLSRKEAFSVSSLAALREISFLKPKANMSKAQAENVLGSFVAKGWLLKSKRGRYSLSGRSLLELFPYLKTTYPEEIKLCRVCKQVLTRGVACFTTDCKTRMHYHCFTAYRRRNNWCPECKADWPREPKEKPLLPIGEDAVKDGEHEKRRTRARDAEDGDEEDAEPVATESIPKNTHKQKGKKAEENDMEIDNDTSDDDNNETEEQLPTSTQGRRRSQRH